MNFPQASKIWLDYHRAHSKENTIRAYEFTITRRYLGKISDTEAT